MQKTTSGQSGKYFISAKCYISDSQQDAYGYQGIQILWFLEPNFFFPMYLLPKTDPVLDFLLTSGARGSSKELRRLFMSAWSIYLKTAASIVGGYLAGNLPTSHSTHFVVAYTTCFQNSKRTWKLYYICRSSEMPVFIILVISER